MLTSRLLKSIGLVQIAFWLACTLTDALSDAHARTHAHTHAPTHAPMHAHLHVRLHGTPAHSRTHVHAHKCPQEPAFPFINRLPFCLSCPQQLGWLTERHVSDVCGWLCARQRSVKLLYIHFHQYLEICVGGGYTVAPSWVRIVMIYACAAGHMSGLRTSK